MKTQEYQKKTTELENINRDYTNQDDPATKNSGESISDKAGEAKDNITEKGSEIRDSAKQKFDDISDTAKDKISQASQTTKESVKKAASVAGEQYRETTEQVKASYDEKSQQIADSFNRNPLAYVGGAFASGLLLGFMLPSSRKERQLVDNPTLRKTGRQIKNRTKDAVQAAKTTATEELKSRNLDSDGLMESAEEIGKKSAESAKKAATK